MSRLLSPNSAVGGGAGGSSKHIPIIIVGNKTDLEADRVVDTADLRRLTDAFPEHCVGVETSAKRNENVEDVFMKLFLLARLPAEMSPSLHRKIQLSSSYVVVGGDSGGRGNRTGGGFGEATTETTTTTRPTTPQPPRSASRRMMSLRRRLSEACGAIALNARRPSIRTDLLLLQARQDGGGRSNIVGVGGGGGTSDCGGGIGHGGDAVLGFNRCVVQ